MTKMRIGWATPFNVRSAIGTFSKVVCDELARRSYDVEAIRIESASELAIEAIDSDYPVVPAAYVDVLSYDLLVINFGNHAPYHAHSLELLSKRSALSIFHDAEMRDFAWGMTNWHGVALPLLPGFELDDDGKTLDPLVHPDAAPLLRTIAGMSCAAIVHGPHYAKTVASSCPGPVEVVPLCFPDTGSRQAAPSKKVNRRVTVFGVINEHKQPRRVMRAVARLGQKGGPVEVNLAGSIEPHFKEELIKEARALKIPSPVFHGYLSDGDLENLLESSQVICALRYPVTEGGSASLITALYRGRPLIVSDVASYSIVPDELVTKVSYGEGIDDLADALETIFNDPAAAEAKARKAREWASDKFSAASYVDALESLLASAIRRSILTDLSRDLASAVQTPGNEPMLEAVKSFGQVLDWMRSSQE